MRTRLSLTWSAVRNSLWFVPTLCTIGGALLATLMLIADEQKFAHAEGLSRFVAGGGPESARALLSAVAGGLITVTGVAFSVMIVALELSSSQYTPRVLPNFMTDRVNQVVIGILIGTFTYSLLVLRMIGPASGDGPQFVPRLAVTGGMALALVSVGALIYFINHSAQSIQISWILERATERALEQVDTLFPEEFGEPDQADVQEDEMPADHARIVAPRSGYIQAIDEDSIFAASRSREAVVKIEHRIGSFVLEGELIARSWPKAVMDDETRRKITQAFRLGRERTSHQDYEFTLIEISDIAVKALSPGINDPTTAQNCIDRLSELLLAFARRHAATRFRTGEGKVHVIVRNLSFERAVESAFASILHFGAAIPSIRDRLLARLDSLIGLVPPPRIEPLVKLRAAVVERSTAEESPVPG